MMRVLDDAAVGPFERVVHAVDDDSGLRAVVAVHSTALGPAVGGTRFHPYASERLRRRSTPCGSPRAMTLKAAAAGLPVGGGKAVIAGDPARLRSPALWRAYAEVIDLFGGAYYTAEDVGTTVADMAALRRHTPYVLGLAGRRATAGTATPRRSPRAASWPRSGPRGRPRPARRPRRRRASSCRASARSAARSPGLLAAEGARLWVSDADPARAAAVARLDRRRRARARRRPSPSPCDVLVPCAMGGVLRPETVPALRCRWVVGAANNQLSRRSRRRRCSRSAGSATCPTSSPTRAA